jgi:hypothetical protein
MSKVDAFSPRRRMMKTLAKLLLFGFLALCVVLPAAGLLALVGLPIALVLGIAAIPVLLVLFLVGLPIFLVFVAVIAVIGVVFGLLGAVVGLGVAALKLALLVALPVLVIGWLINRVRERRVASATTWDR